MSKRRFFAAAATPSNATVDSFIGFKDSETDRYLGEGICG